MFAHVPRGGNVAIERRTRNPPKFPAELADTRVPVFHGRLGETDLCLGEAELAAAFAATGARRLESAGTMAASLGAAIAGELGYRIRRSAWGNGYATEGSLALIRKGFTELGVRLVFAETMAVTLASRRVMEKAGLRYVRTFHQDWPYRIPGDEHGDADLVFVEVQAGRPELADVWLTLGAPRDDGGADVWQIEGAPPGWMSRQGFERSSLTECWVGLVFSSPALGMNGSSVRWM